jgi:hypothetical protein
LKLRNFSPSLRRGPWESEFPEGLGHAEAGIMMFRGEWFEWAEVPTSRQGNIRMLLCYNEILKEKKMSFCC